VATSGALPQAQFGGGPFIFSGVPPILTGEIDLTNPSNEKVKVRSIPVVGRKDRSAKSIGLTELLVGARLAPKQRLRASAQILIDPSTPPGSYSAEVSLGGESKPIVAHVFENAHIHVEPSVIRLRGAGGDVLTSLTVVSNRGNVTETMRDVALVFLEERNWVGRSLVYALREVAEDDGHQAYFDRVVHELRTTNAGPAKVSISGDHDVLRPGETAEVNVEITLPKELIKGRTYIGSTPFMSGKLSFEVEANGSINSTKRRPR
jgi:hypothetical protein